jgi:short-subunit dehydrogenase
LKKKRISRRRPTVRREQQTVFITGASEGIGRATALRFASAGCHVLASARSSDRLASLKKEIEEQTPGSCETLTLDLSDTEGILPGIESFVGTRDIDIAVVNAGVGQYGPFASSPWNDIGPLLRVNIDGAMATVRAMLPGMLRRGHGSIVVVSSTIGKRAIPFNAAYCASKFALQGFTEALRLELRPHGIHVGVVCPARTDTQFFDRMTMSTPQQKRRAVPTSSPSRVADAIVRCARRRKREIVVSPEGKLFAFVGTHFPRLTDVILYHSVPRPEDS